MFKHIKSFVMNKREGVSNYFRKKQDAELARAEGFASGTTVASTEFTSKIKNLTHSIAELTEENIVMEKKLRTVYDERVDVLDTRYTKKCDDCMRATDRERKRLRKNQNAILDLIQNFNIVYMKLFKHASFIMDEHDNIIKSSGRVKASRDTLTVIRKEANSLIQTALPLLGIDVTEKMENKLLQHDEIINVEKQTDKVQ